MRAKKTRHWRKLDNAAKIFPPTSTNRDTKVFRFSCELYEEIVPEFLQQALDKTMKRFHYYGCIIRKGLFWFYFEESSLRPMVAEESKPPCRNIYHVDSKQLLFEVTYYKKRINLEVYHALSDGTGALNFLETLVTYYLSKRYPEDFKEHPPQIDYDASKSQLTNDSFKKYYKKVPINRQKENRAYQLRGERNPEYRISVIEGIAPVKKVLALAHDYHATATEFLTALLIKSIHEGMSLQEQGLPVSIAVPVNLRKFFPSASSRNFFGVINIAHDFSRHGDSLEEIIQNVQEQFRQQLTAERLQEKMSLFTTIEHNLLTKLVPLMVKIPVLKIANWVADRSVTASLSNIGKIEMPEPLRKYIRLFDVFTSTRRLQICMCSYEEHMVISFTSSFVSTDVQRVFFRTLTAMDIPLTIHATTQDEEGESHEM